MSKRDEQNHRLDQACDAFIQAAAMLSGRTRFERHAVSAALVFASLGLLRLTQSDPDGREIDSAVEIVRAAVSP